MGGVDTLYAELLWIARKAGLKDGWAWFRFKELSSTPPTKLELAHKPVVPSKSLIEKSKDRMSAYRFKRLTSAYEYATLTEDQKEALRKERAKDKVFTARAYKALDMYRPRLDDM